MAGEQRPGDPGAPVLIDGPDSVPSPGEAGAGEAESHLPDDPLLERQRPEAPRRLPVGGRQAAMQPEKEGPVPRLGLDRREATGSRAVGLDAGEALALDPLRFDPRQQILLRRWGGVRAPGRPDHGHHEERTDHPHLVSRVALPAAVGLIHARFPAGGAAFPARVRERSSESGGRNPHGGFGSRFSR